jgi:hypothetical protein
MPYPQEHSCRLAPPENYEKFRRGKRKHEGKEYGVIYGKLKDEDKWEEQAYRYDKEVWEASEAKAHCGKHDGMFEPAKKQAGLGSVDLEKVQEAVNTLQALLGATESGSEPVKATRPEEVAKEAAELEGIVATLKAENEGFDVKEAEGRIESMLDQLKWR